MLSREELANKPFMQLLLILCLCLVSIVLFSIIGGLVAVANYGMDMLSIQDYSNPQVIEGLKLIQLFSAIGLFLIPPIFYGIIASKTPRINLGLISIRKPINYVFIAILMIVSTPFLSWIIELNENMAFPDFMAGLEQWMRTSEIQAAELTNAFLTFDGIGSLIYVLIIVAVVPAIGEELLFRGVLQKIFIQWTKNPHWGIWITAILFSALHMQFFGFFPRMLLGVLFGYIFYWSKSLWLPILGHFINNGSVVLVSYFVPDMMENADIALFEESDYSTVFYMLSLVLSLGLIFLIRRVNQNVS